VTAVQLSRVEQPSTWQKQFAQFSEEQMKLLKQEPAGASV